MSDRITGMEAAGDNIPINGTKNTHFNKEVSTQSGNEKIICTHTTQGYVEAQKEKKSI